ncbi:hypothetical protein [Gilvimarinus chinensis]|uniref:hypothetical protein n=1 Tax=Gilvimarinus chinensis TaxID=396005 RepID=UPI00037F7AAA|nr:hypothetical protein [Gilvimarinus chinensis]
MVLALLACALTCGATGVLFSAWRRSKPTPLTTLAGWLLLLMAMLIWSAQSGPEFGVSFTLLTLALAAWCFALATADHRQQKTKPQPRGQLPLARIRTIGHQLWRVITVVLLAGTVSVSALVALGKLSPLSAVNAMVMAALLSPLLWGLMSYWLLADPRRARPILSLLLTGLVSGVVILL